MSNEEILKKAIEKAVKNGWKLSNFKFNDRTIRFFLSGTDWFAIIFSHDFLKAIFGEKIIKVVQITGTKNKYGDSQWEYVNKIEWQHHGCEMVLEENPLKYLEKYI